MKKIILMLAIAGICFSAEAGRRIVFIGDSITDGNWGCVYNYKPASSQRSHTDMNHIYGHSYVMLIAAEIQGRKPSAGYEFFNRGFSGHKLPDLAARWQEDVLDLHPDVLSVLVGINDVGNYVNNGTGEFDLEGWKQLYRQLLIQVREQNPSVVLALGAPFTTKENYTDLTAKLAAAVRELCQEFGAICIPYDQMFGKLVRKGPSPEYWIWDGVHPTPAGHYRIARLWLKKVKQISIH